MNGDLRKPQDADRMSDTQDAPGSGSGRPPVPAAVSEDTQIAIEVRELVERSKMDATRERFATLVTAHQRKTSRIAYQYLRDAAEADEAIQDAFLKVFSHIGTYRKTWPFEVWFTRILINGCLDR